jgi:hypothetical protein
LEGERFPHFFFFSGQVEVYYKTPLLLSKSYKFIIAPYFFVIVATRGGKNPLPGEALSLKS